MDMASEYERIELEAKDFQNELQEGWNESVSGKDAELTEMGLAGRATMPDIDTEMKSESDSTPDIDSETKNTISKFVPSQTKRELGDNAETSTRDMVTDPEQVAVVVSVAKLPVYDDCRQHVKRLTAQTDRVLEKQNAVASPETFDENDIKGIEIIFLKWENQRSVAFVDTLKSIIAEAQQTDVSSTDVHSANIFVADYNDKDRAFGFIERKADLNDVMLVLTKENADSDDDIPRDKLICTASPEHVLDNIDNLLERYIFKHLESAALKLQEVLETVERPQPTLRRSARKRNHEEAHPTNDDATQSKRKPHLRMKSVSIAQGDVIEVKELLFEIMGMFLRSNVPMSERPQQVVHETTVSTQLDTQLRNTVPVLGWGHRLGVLTIFADASGDDKSKTEARDKIKDILLAHGIMEHVVQFTCKEITPFAKYNVGSRIGSGTPASKFSASIGCFADDKLKTGTKYVLLSKHVAHLIYREQDNCPDVYLLNDQCEPIHKIGNIVMPCDGPLDVSVAKILNLKDNYDTRLKTSKGEPTLCQMVDLCATDQSLYGLPVHIWGACTNPGVGKITMLNCTLSNCLNDAYILIEDMEGSVEPFSKEGDSGALVCADGRGRRFVRAISFLQGERLDNQTQGRRQYYTIRLQPCLDQLSNQHGGKYTLCDQLKD